MLNALPLGAGVWLLAGFSKGFTVGIEYVEAVVESMLLGGKVCTSERWNNTEELILSPSSSLLQLPYKASNSS